MCFKILELIIGWKNHYWVLCLSGAFVFKRHFTLFLVYYAAFSGLYLYSLIVILLLKPKNVQRSPETCGGVTEKLKCRVIGAFSMGRRRAVITSSGTSSLTTKQPGQGSASGLEEERGSAFLSRQVIRSTFFFF